MTDTMNGRARAVATRPALASGIRDRVARHLLQAAILVAFLLLWQYASGRWVAPLFISSPVAVWDTVVRWIADGTLLHHAVATFRVAVAGFLIGGLSAVVFGYLLGVSRFWAGVAEPFITALYVLRAVRMIFLGPAPVGHHDLRDARGTEWATLVILGGALVVLGVWPRILLTPLNAGVAELLTRLGN